MHKYLFEFGLTEWDSKNILKWIYKFGNAKDSDEWDCALAGENGHLKLLQWLHKNEYPWNEWTCAYAAREGQLKVLQWARQQVPPAPWDAWTCELAARGGHLRVLPKAPAVQWARENGAPE